MVGVLAVFERIHPCARPAHVSQRISIRQYCDITLTRIFRYRPRLAVIIQIQVSSLLPAVSALHHTDSISAPHECAIDDW